MPRRTRTKLTQFVREMVATEYVRGARPALRSPADVYNYCAPQMQNLPVEEMRVLVVDAQHNLVADCLVSRGILNTSLVHPREVFAAAIHHRAAAVILVHNHPSGLAEPSGDDVAVSQQMREAGNVLGIPVHDHIIIGTGSFTSLVMEGKM